MKRLDHAVPTLLAGLALLASCSPPIKSVEKRALPRPNPTSYTFPLPVAEVHEKAWRAFSIEHQVDHPIFGHTPGMGFVGILSAERATNALFGKNIFRDPANKNDIYLHTFHSPFEVSPVYHNSQAGLPFIAAFHLHLAASGKNTVVTVIASDTEVIAGTRFGIGPGGPGRANVYVSVEPTTIEEYSILRYIGSYIGVTNMPPVRLPTP